MDELYDQTKALYVHAHKDPTIQNGINLWIVSDNLRKGAALNAVQIAETLIAKYALKPKSVAA
jgi:aspartate-semialdehyde dehydrogenase